MVPTFQYPCVFSCLFVLFVYVFTCSGWICPRELSNKPSASPIGDQKHDIAEERKGTNEFDKEGVGEAEEEDEFLLDEINLDNEEKEDEEEEESNVLEGVGMDVLQNALKEYDDHPHV